MTDPTRIIQGPVDMEIIVGESIVLPCQVASDPVLDVSFSWAFNGQLITKGNGHFELVGGVSDTYSYIAVYVGREKYHHWKTKKKMWSRFHRE